MKKILAMLIITTLLVASASFAVFADKGGITPAKSNNAVFKISGSSVITMGRFKLPLGPVEKGMGADVTYLNGVIKITKDTRVVEFDLNNKKVYITVNGVRTEDKNSGIFTPSNEKKMTVPLKYIAVKLGIKIDIKGDDVIIPVPELNAPTAVTVTVFGGNLLANTLNSTSLYLTAQAIITAGQATGGKAELYVGNKLIATDNAIGAGDTTVTFNTSDGTPTAAELQALVTTGGMVTVKLYNAASKHVTSKTANPTLAVDYSAPVITGLLTAIYYPAQKVIDVYVSGNLQKDDVLDITKVQIFDAAPALTRVLSTGTTGKAQSSNVIRVSLGSTDATALATVGGEDAILTLLAGILVTDSAGNPPAAIAAPLSVKLITVLP